MAGSGYPLKRRFLDLAKVTFFADHKAENQFFGLDDPLKHHILDLGQVAFWADQKAKNEFADPGDA
jgi:hypothetical protein